MKKSSWEEEKERLPGEADTWPLTLEGKPHECVLWRLGPCFGADPFWYRCTAQNQVDQGSVSNG